MIGFMKNWITSISICVFFIVAIESILPDNNLKKYAKFVLGLILIVSIINPIINLFNKNINILNTIDDYKYIINSSNSLKTNNYSNNKNKMYDSTIKIFKSNLENQCQKKLKLKYPDKDFKVNIEVKYDNKTNNFKIESLNLGVNKSNLVKKVVIDTKKDINQNKSIDENLKKSIKNYIRDEFEISPNIINIYLI